MFTFLGVMVAYMVASRYPFRKWAALALLGLLIGYIANIFRLTILILVAMKYGMGTMQWVHAYLGTVLFVGWNLLFWIPVLYYFKKKGFHRTSRDDSRSGS